MAKEMINYFPVATSCLVHAEAMMSRSGNDNSKRLIVRTESI